MHRMTFSIPGPRELKSGSPPNFCENQTLPPILSPPGDGEMSLVANYWIRIKGNYLKTEKVCKVK